MSNLEAALEYIARGWSVIPVSRTSKRPLIKWKEFQGRVPTKAEAEQWWTDWPGANIAVVTGAISGIVIVDIDERSGGSIDEQRHADAPTLGVRTPGGHHLYYAHPGHVVKNSVDQKTGTDVRGDGGYALLPPSLKDNGQKYCWSNELDISDLPAWVGAGDDAQQSLPEKAKDGPSSPEPWLERTISEGPSPGSRNDTAARLAGYLAGKGIPIEVGIEFVRAWNANGNGLGDEELLTTVRSIYDAEKLKPPDDFGIVVNFEGEPQTGEAAVALPSVRKVGAFDLTPHSEYIEKHAGDDAWLFDGWLPDETIAMLVAAPGSCKTWVELDMAVCIAGGGPFMGRVKPQRTGPVIVVQQEDGPKQIQTRVMTIQCVREGVAQSSLDDKTLLIDMPGDLPIYYHEDARLRFASQDAMDELERKIAAIRPVAIFIDPLYSAASAENNMAEAPMQMIRLKQWRQKYRCSFIFVHHRVKGGKYGREGAWGSQLLNGFIETGYQMYKLSDGRVILDRHTKADGDLDPLIVEFDICTKSDWRYSQSMQIITAERAKALVEADNEGRLGDEPSAPTRRPAKKSPGKPRGEDTPIYEFLVSPDGRKGAKSPSAISKAMSVTSTPASVLRGLDRLEAAGLVFRNGQGWSASFGVELIQD